MNEKVPTNAIVSQICESFGYQFYAAHTPVYCKQVAGNSDATIFEAELYQNCKVARLSTIQIH